MVSSLKGVKVMVRGLDHSGSQPFILYTCVGGEFGAFMQVHIQNDGPVTLHIESPRFPPAKEVLLMLIC